MQVIRNSLGYAISRSRNLAGIRRAVGRQAVYGVAISSLPRGEGFLRIDFMNGDYFETTFADFGVLMHALRNWRNLYGAPLVVDGKHRGKVAYGNPALQERAPRWFLF